MPEQVITRSRGAAERAFSPVLIGWVVLAVAGVALGWNKGQLPRRELPAAVTDSEAIAPDLALYCEMIAAVRRGDNYYDAAREAIPRYGFPIHSPLNWRLPTYAWLLSRLPCTAWIQATLIGLSLVALSLAAKAQAHRRGLFCAACTTLLLFGVVTWSIDGYACVAQEPWAATLLVISLSAYSLGEDDPRWRWVSIAAGLSALLFRELALPFCGIAFVLAVGRRRWAEAAGWSAALAIFVALFAWHVFQVRNQLALSGSAPEGGVGQWLSLGGIDFVLLTTRMNRLLMAAPAWLLWLYLVAALAGQSRGRDATSQLACLSTAAYLLAFAVLGRPENFYWGLIPAPLLAWGAASAPFGRTGEVSPPFVWSYREADASRSPII
jgi:hypothetical protein